MPCAVRAEGTTGAGRGDEWVLLLLRQLDQDEQLVLGELRAGLADVDRPVEERRLGATDTGTAITGQHIDVFTGTGAAAQEETFRITSNNSRVCFESRATE